MYKINQNNLFWELLTNHFISGLCDHSNFNQWGNETPELIINLIKRGEMDLPEKHWRNNQYWGENAPIVFSWYPYHSCEIYQCLKCKAFFFHYIEGGGHGEQKRYRVINLELIDKKDFKPDERAIIDYRSYNYALAKYPNGDLELSVCRIDIGPGIDIFHVLTKEEKDEYYKGGITKLQERIDNMTKNYSEYKISGWR